MRSGAVHHSRDHPVCNMACGPKETVYPSYDSGMLSDETINQFDLRHDWIRTEKPYKKEKQNSSELAEPRRSPTACFGSYQKDETESDATQVVGSQPEVRSCGAQATREAKYKYLYEY